MSDKKKQLVVEAIKEGTVVDHIPADRTLQIVEYLTNLDTEYFLGVNLASTSIGRKGIIKIMNTILEEDQLELLGFLAPEATVNIIKDYQISDKFSPEAPQQVTGLFECPNHNCITAHENIPTVFTKVSKGMRCHYCERTFLISRMQLRRPE